MKKQAKTIFRRAVYNILPGHEPGFLIIGAQKSGTTSLHHYLNSHPVLVGSRPKEINYFTVDSIYAKGNKWYRSQFKTHRSIFTSKIYFESSADYLYRSYVPERIFKFNKNLKFIVVFREPVARAYSAWNMHRDFRTKHDSLPYLIRHGYFNDREHNSLKELYSTDVFPAFEECIESELMKIKSGSQLEEPSFIRKGFYIEQIDRYLKYFDINQFLFLGSKELLYNKEQALDKVTNFLSLDQFEWDEDLLKDRHRRSYDEPIKPETAAMLSHLYQPYNEKLFKKIGPLNW